MAKILWVGRKHILGQPLSFTFYKITEEKLFIKRGLIGINEEEIYLYKVKDKKYSQTMMQKIFGVGSMELTVSDGETLKLRIEDIKDSIQVKQILDKIIGDTKAQYGLHGSEMFGSSSRQEK